MHSAPSVNYPVGRSPLVARVLVAAWVAGACTVAGWRYQIDRNVDMTDWRMWVLIAALGMAALGVRRAIRKQPSRGELRWDGQYWLLHADREQGGAIATVHLDLQMLMLVRVAPAEGPAQWLWMQRDLAPSQWRALRRALYSRPPSTENVTTAHAFGTPPHSARAHPDSNP